MVETAPLRPLSRPRLYEPVAQRILTWVRDTGLKAGDRLPPERDLATRLGVSRATVGQALVAMAMAVDGIAHVRHGDGAVLVDMERDIGAGGCGVDGDESFHGAVTLAGHSEANRDRDPDAAAAPMRAHVDQFSDLALLRD